MTMIINSASDLEAAKNTPGYADLLRNIAGAAYYWENDAQPGETTRWVRKENSATLAALGVSASALDAECAAHGVTVKVPVTPRNFVTPEAQDQRPKDLAGIKEFEKRAVDTKAKYLLSTSDWMVIRKIENATEIPAPWADYRSAVRSYSTTLKTQFDSAKNIPVLESLVSSAVWPTPPAAQPQA